MIFNATVQDLGNLSDADDRTVIVTGVLTNGSEIKAAVVLQEGRASASPEMFEIEGAWNVEAACRAASEGEDFEDSVCGLLELEIKELAERA